MSHLEYLDELTRVAPLTDRTLLRVLARLLARDGASDAVRVANTALAEATTDLMIEGRLRAAGELGALGAIIDRETCQGRGNFW
jgi:hypothetical protein